MLPTPGWPARSGNFRTIDPTQLASARQPNCHTARARHPKPPHAWRGGRQQESPALCRAVTPVAHPLPGRAALVVPSITRLIPPFHHSEGATALALRASPRLQSRAAQRLWGAAGGKEGPRMSLVVPVRASTPRPCVGVHTAPADLCGGCGGTDSARGWQARATRESCQRGGGVEQQASTWCSRSAGAPTQPRTVHAPLRVQPFPLASSHAVPRRAAPPRARRSFVGRPGRGGQRKGVAVASAAARHTGSGIVIVSGISNDSDTGSDRDTQWHRAAAGTSGAGSGIRLCRCAGGARRRW